MSSSATTALEEYLYSVPPLDRKRTQPMQILCVGFPRSGTDSLKSALQQLGYDGVYHGLDAAASASDLKAWYLLSHRKWHTPNPITASDFDQILGESVAITDMPAVVFTPELIAAYPDAKVILNTRRDLDAWQTSMWNTFGVVQYDKWRWFKGHFNAAQFWREKFFKDCYFVFFYHDLHTATWVNRNHSAMVRGMVEKDKLLEWRVEDGWESLCGFLGKGVPKGEFPNGNTPKELFKRLGELNKEADRRAYTNMALSGGVLVGLAAVVAKLVVPAVRRLL